MHIYIIYLTLLFYRGSVDTSLVVTQFKYQLLYYYYYNIIIIVIIIIIIIIIILRYDWEIADLPAMCTCGDLFTVDHAMVCRHGGLIIQRHNEIRDLEAEMLRMVCTDVETEPVLQEITGEELNKAPDARLDVHTCWF